MKRPVHVHRSITADVSLTRCMKDAPEWHRNKPNYLLIEFQSSVDKYMALRMMVYQGLLYQDLIRQGAVLSEGRLPPVLPIVLYNGSQRWTAATEAEGVQKGMQQGIQQGMQQGEALALQKLLTKRFGVIPPDILARIASASQDQVEAWLDRVLDVLTLDEVFSPLSH